MTIVSSKAFELTRRRKEILCTWAEARAELIGTDVVLLGHYQLQPDNDRWTHISHRSCINRLG